MAFLTAKAILEKIIQLDPETRIRLLEDLPDKTLYKIDGLALSEDLDVKNPEVYAYIHDICEKRYKDNNLEQSNNFKKRC